MKYLKTYEDLGIKSWYFRGKEIKKNDFILIKINFSSITQKKAEDINNFINNNFGTVISINSTTDQIIVKYDKIPKNIKSWFGYKINEKYYFRTFYLDRIVDWASTEEELKFNLATNKFNL